MKDKVARIIGEVSPGLFDNISRIIRRSSEEIKLDWNETINVVNIIEVDPEQLYKAYLNAKKVKFEEIDC